MQTAGMEIEGRDRAWAAADCCGADPTLACLSHTNDPSLAVKGPAFYDGLVNDELGVERGCLSIAFAMTKKATSLQNLTGLPIWQGHPPSPSPSPFNPFICNLHMYAVTWRFVHTRRNGCLLHNSLTPIIFVCLSTLLGMAQ